MGRHKLVDQGVMVATVAAACSLVDVAALATWLAFPHLNISCPQALKTRGRASLYVSRRGICRPVLGV